MPYQTNKLSLGVGLYNPQSPLDFFIICGYLRNLWFFSCPLVNLVHLCGQLSGICGFFLRLFFGVFLGALAVQSYQCPSVLIRGSFPFSAYSID